MSDKENEMIVSFLRDDHITCRIIALKSALRRIHDGTDRGELKELLNEAWGPSHGPSDLRGLAAREAG